MTEFEDSRASLCISMERMALWIRYAIYFIVVPLFLLGHIQGSMPDLVLVTIVVGLHNLFAHLVLLTGRYRFFFSTLNFVIYLAEASLVVSFTGAEESPAYVLYFLFMIGFSAYVPRFWRVFLVSALCVACYTTVILVEWARVGIAVPLGEIVAKMLFLLSSGWLLGALSEQLFRAEQEALSHAEALAASEATLRTILNSAADPLVVYDDNEFITEANERAGELLGLPREELLGKRVRAFLFDDGTLPQKMAALRHRGTARGEDIVVNAAGDERTVDYTVRSYIRGKKRYFVAIFHDLTEQKNLQEATRLANSNLERLNAELRQVNELKTGFWSVITQKVRSPLAAILGYLEMLLEEELGEVTSEQRRALNACRRAVLRSFKLIDEGLLVPEKREKPEEAGEDNVGTEGFPHHAAMGDEREP